MATVRNAEVVIARPAAKRRYRAACSDFADDFECAEARTGLWIESQAGTEPVRLKAGIKADEPSEGT